MLNETGRTKIQAQSVAILKAADPVQVPGRLAPLTPRLALPATENPTGVAFADASMEAVPMTVSTRAHCAYIGLP